MVVLTLEGAVNPTYLRYVTGGLGRAQASGASVVLLRIDTPGADVDSMRKMVEAIMTSTVPIVTYVAPYGARAGSAGTFVAAAGHVAAMSPTSNIGAATPVSGTGADLPTTLKSKAVNNAAALIKSIAETRERNAEKLEATVREAASFTAQQAVDLRIVDLIADSNNDLLSKIDDKVVKVAGRTTALWTAGPSCDQPMAGCADIGMTWAQRFLVFISHPTVSFLLFVLGALGLMLELMNPGLVGPGVFGAIALALAFLSFGILPVNWVGVGLMLFGLAMVLFKWHVGAFRAVGAGGIVAFIIGLILLFEPFSPAPPAISRPEIVINPWVFWGIAASAAITFAVLIFLAWRGKQSGPSPPRTAGLIGKTVRVTSNLTPIGTVQAESEHWTAESSDGATIASGEKVVVTAVSGLTLMVMQQRQQSPSGPNELQRP